MAAFVALISIGCSAKSTNGSAVEDGPARSATARLRALDGSDVTGAARFTKAGNDRVRVIVEVDPSTGRRSAHIHQLRCAEESAVKQDLPEVVNGHSETVIPGSVQGLVGPVRSVAVHETADPSSPHVASGVIRRR